jgi:hypothetical protein
MCIIFPAKFYRMHSFTDSSTGTGSDSKRPTYAHNSQHKPTERNQSRHAIELIAMHFQATARAQWDKRNQHLHVSQDNQQSFTRTVACQEIALIYDQLHTILLLDRPAITQGITLQDRLEHSTKRLKHWLRRTRPLFKLPQRQAKERPAHTSDIRSYFSTGRPPGPRQHG